MITTIGVTNPAGLTLALYLGSSGEQHGLEIFNFTGLGPPKATPNSIGGPNIPGVSVTSVKLDARQMILTLAVVATPMWTEEESRKKVYDYFPIGKTVTLQIVTDDEKNMTIPAIVESNEFNQFAKVENAVIGLYCPYPFFQDIVEENPSISSGGTTVVYDGEVETGIEATITFTDTFWESEFTITNDNNNQSMTVGVFMSTAIGGPGIPVANDKIVIISYHGQKSITFWRGSSSWNFINKVGLNDDWLTLFTGNNLIEYDAPAQKADLDMDIKYKKLWEGV